MKSKEFIAELARRIQKSPEETSRMSDILISEMTHELENENTISIQEFGSFEVKKKAERISVNPTNHQRMLVPPKLVLAFRPHGKLKDKFK